MDTLLHTYPLTQEIFNATEYTGDIGVALKHFTWLWEGLPESERQGWIDEHYRVFSLYQEIFPDWERNPRACESIIRPSPEDEADMLIQNAFRKYPLGSFEATVQRDSVNCFDLLRQYESLMGVWPSRFRRAYKHYSRSRIPGISSSLRGTSDTTRAHDDWSWAIVGHESES
jgi:hypothetical protein